MGYSSAGGIKGLGTFNDTASTEADFEKTIELIAAVGNYRVDTETNRDALSGAKLYEGLMLWNTDQDQLEYYDGSGWKVLHKGWTTYTPTVTNITATTTAAYTRVGDAVFVEIRAVLTAAMTAQPSFTLPVTAADANPDYLAGDAYLRDASPSTEYSGMVRKLTTTTVGPYCTNTAGTYSTTANVGLSNAPFTWASGDTIEMNFWYRAA